MHGPNMGLVQGHRTDRVRVLYLCACLPTSQNLGLQFDSAKLSHIPSLAPNLLQQPCRRPHDSLFPVRILLCNVVTAVGSPLSLRHVITCVCGQPPGGSGGFDVLAQPQLQLSQAFSVLLRHGYEADIVTQF